MVKIYERVEKIFAQKGRKSNYPKEKFVHTFKAKAEMFGLPNGSLLIKSPTGRKLWDLFEKE